MTERDALQNDRWPAVRRRRQP